MSVTRGKVHKYLGMVIDFSSKGKVKFRMDDYVMEMLNDFQKNRAQGHLVNASIVEPV